MRPDQAINELIDLELKSVDARRHVEFTFIR